MIVDAYRSDLPANPWLSHIACAIDAITPEIARRRHVPPAIRRSARQAALSLRPGSSTCSICPASARSRSRVSGSELDGRTRWAHTMRVAGNVTRALVAAGRRRHARSARPLGTPLAARSTARAPTSCWSPAASGLPRCGPPIDKRFLRNAIDFGRVTLILRCAHARTPCCTRCEYASWVAGDIDVQTTVDRATPAWRGNIGVVPLLLDRLRPLDPRQYAALHLRARSDDALYGAQRLRPGNVVSANLGSRWSAICNAPWACAGTASLGRPLSARTAPCFATTEIAPFLRRGEPMNARRPTLAVFKFASCDGCQLSLLAAEDELLAVAGTAGDRPFSRSHQPYASPVRTTWRWSRARSPRPTMPSAFAKSARDVEVSDDDWRLRHGRRNPGTAQLGRFRRISASVYAQPEYIHTLARPPRSRIMCRWISSCAAARSTSINCSKCCCALLAGLQPRTPTT